jgi:hypothetical protein
MLQEIYKTLQSKYGGTTRQDINGGTTRQDINDLDMKAQAQYFSKKNTNELREKLNNVNRVCWEWTKDSCEDSCDDIPDFISTLEIYAEITHKKKDIKDYTIPSKYKEGYEIIEIYRKAYTDYWTEVTDNSKCLPYMYYPGRYEMIHFCTFHYAIWMTNHLTSKKNEVIIKSDEEVYHIIMNHLKTPPIYSNKKTRYDSEIRHIESYREKIPFDDIQKRALKKITKPRTWWQYLNCEL